MNSTKPEYYDNPTFEYPNGTKEWKKNGKYHRDNDLPALIYHDGTMTWYKNGLLHRDGDKPAHITTNNEKLWYVNGKNHRVNAPAVIALNNDGNYKRIQWWYDGLQYDFIDYCQVCGLSESQIVELKLKYDI